MNSIGVVQNSQKSAKQLAIDAAKKAAREPLEILKAAANQATRTEQSKNSEMRSSQKGAPMSENSVGPTTELKKRIQMQRMMEAFEKELQDIRNQKKQELMQQAQQEQVIVQQKQQEKKQGFLGAITAQARKSSKGIGFGKKKGAQPQGTNKMEAKKP